ncbi:MAG: GGDEF domain-containing protein [Clostridia bacterium]|nr:GGDEF domain-containing protein [Clostridia bacterium]
MFKKLQEVFLYTPVDHNTMDRIRPKIKKANLTMTTILSTFATALIAAMLISSFISNGTAKNKVVYAIGLVMSVTISLTSVSIAKKHSSLIVWLIYLSYSIYYLYGILIGTITDPEGKTVTFMVLLAFLPTLFIEKVSRIITITCFYVSLFIILCYRNKEGDVLTIDVIDSIVFAILGLVSGFVVNNMKIRSYILEVKLQEISRIDQLTQMRNRNAFEFEHDLLPGLCKNTLGIVYIDVNGLHEVNNQKGHDAGDKMLKCIASEVKNTFSEEFSYRIGGDEFVAFTIDQSEDKIRELIHEIIQKIEEKGYHIAIGFDVAKTRHLDLEGLIDSAEKKMLNDKNLYYKNIANRQIRNNKRKD